MARNIGPEMLASLERRFAEGEIDQATFDSRRTEITELIRKGRAVELSRVEKAVWGGMAVLISVLGATLLIGGVTAGNLISIVIAIAMIAFGLNRLAVVRRY